jgi:hypothetical protein
VAEKHAGRARAEIDRSPDFASWAVQSVGGCNSFAVNIHLNPI